MSTSLLTTSRGRSIMYVFCFVSYGLLLTEMGGEKHRVCRADPLGLKFPIHPHVVFCRFPPKTLAHKTTRLTRLPTRILTRTPAPLLWQWETCCTTSKEWEALAEELRNSRSSLDHAVLE